MPVVAITGNIATGKSTFTGLLSLALSAPTFDTDLCARRLLAENTEVAHAVRIAFGGSVFDHTGQIDRKALRQAAFGAIANRRALESILHPRVRTAWTQWAYERLQTAPDSLLMVEIPLLYETAAAGLFDRVIVVGCSGATQMRRLTVERQLPIDLARQILSSQWVLAGKIPLADSVIWNDGSTAGLQIQVDLCARQLRSQVSGPSSPSSP